VQVTPAPSITPTTLAAATPNAAYSATLDATGGAGTLTWTLASGSLPTGLSLSASGAITGTPTVSGAFDFTAKVTDSSAASQGPESAQGKISLTVVTPVSITTTTLPSGSQSIAYKAGIDASGGTTPYTWSLTVGQLPAGLALESTSGEISGTPIAQGKSAFTVAVKDSSPTPQTQSQALSIIIGPPQPLAITTTTLTNATPNANYSATLQATGGEGPFTWTLASGALPTGLALSGSGVISGDPTVSGTADFTVQVTDSETPPVSVKAKLSLTVVTELSITTTALAAGAQGTTYLEGMDATGGTPPYTWSLKSGSLPSGLAMQSSSGVISGSPTAQGTFNFTVAVQDSSPTPQSQSESLAIPIGAPGPLAITTTALLDGTVSKTYNARIAALGGTPPLTWSLPAGPLPAGLSLAVTTGAITGTPPSTGTTSFSVEVTDSSSPPQSQTQQLSITVDSAPEACQSSGNEAALKGPYVFSLSGFNNTGFLTVVGSFTADGTGKVTAGEADSSGVLGAQNGNILTLGSSYSVGSDGRGCATLATPFGTLLTHLALGAMTASVATGGRMIEWDSPSSSAYIAAGQLLQQSPTALTGGLAGNYVFRTVGWDSSALGGRDVCVGAFSAGGNTLTSLEEDCNDAWTLSTLSAPDVAGTVTTLDTNGRGTGIVSLGDSNSNIAFYVVSPAQLLVVGADPNPAMSGEWDQQTMPAGGAGFTQASLEGSMVFYLSGLSLVGTASTVSMETASADGSSSIAITFYEDRAGTMQVSSTYTCTYEVEPNGRVTLSSATQTCGGTPPVFYLSGPNAGFIVDASPGVDTGYIEPQTGGPYTNATLTGNFFGGLEAVVMQSAQAEVDPVAPNGSGSITGKTDLSSMSAQDEGSSFLAATYTVNSDGTFVDNATGGEVAGVIISSTKFVMFSPTTLATSLPTLLVMEK
jgi:hypothetical protein